MSCLLSTITSQGAANLGNLLTGVAALGGVIAATLQFQTWRRQEQLKKKSEVAASVLNTTIRAFQAIKYVTGLTVDSPKDEAEENGQHKKTYQLRRDYKNRVAVVVKDIDAFILAWNTAQIYFDATINEKLENLWKEWISVGVDIQQVCSLRDVNEERHPEHIRAYNASFGKEGQDKRDKMEKELKDLLIPIARLQSE